VLEAGEHCHLVEVKITASETESEQWGQRGKPQLQRYVDLGRGDVTYLTTVESLTPEVDHRGRKFRFVKHAFLEDLHKELGAVHSSPLVGFLREFMEDNYMAGPKSFNQTELKRSEDSLEFVHKCQDTLAIVRNDVNKKFRQNFHTHSNLTRPGIRQYGVVESYLKGYHRKGITWVGILLSGEEGGLYFSVWAYGRLDGSMA